MNNLKYMNKLKKGLISLIVLSGLLAVSGCKQFTIGGFQPIDRSKSAYKQEYLEKANGMIINKENSRELIDCYGSLKEFDRMDNVVKKMVDKDLEGGMSSGDMGDKTYDFFKIKPKK